jgi:hypothetical protein
VRTSLTLPEYAGGRGQHSVAYPPRMAEGRLAIAGAIAALVARAELITYTPKRFR